MVLDILFAIFQKNDPPAVLMVCAAGTVIVRRANPYLSSLRCKGSAFFLYHKLFSLFFFKNKCRFACFLIVRQWATIRENITALDEEEATDVELVQKFKGSR